MQLQTNKTHLGFSLSCRRFVGWFVELSEIKLDIKVLTDKHKYEHFMEHNLIFLKNLNFKNLGSNKKKYTETIVIYKQSHLKVRNHTLTI